MTSRDKEIAELEDQLGWAMDDHKESYELTVKLAAKVTVLADRLDVLRADETQWYMGHSWTADEVRDTRPDIALYGGF